MSDIYKALAKAQGQMGGARKTARNPHFKTNYADLESVQEACLEPLRAAGFAVFQPAGRDEYGPYVDTIFAHESGEVVKCRVHLVLSKNDMQGLGSAITYARRYGLMCLSGVAPEDDDGSASVQQTQASRQTPPPKPEPPQKPPANEISEEDAIENAVAAFDRCKTPQEVEKYANGVFRRWGHDRVPQAVKYARQRADDRCASKGTFVGGHP